MKLCTDTNKNRTIKETEIERRKRGKCNTKTLFQFHRKICKNECIGQLTSAKCKTKEEKEKNYFTEQKNTFYLYVYICIFNIRFSFRKYIDRVIILIE